MPEMDRTDRQRTPETDGGRPADSAASARFLVGLTAAGAAVVAAALFAEPTPGQAPWVILAALALVLLLLSVVGFAAGVWGAPARRRGLLRIAGLSAVAAVAVIAVAVGVRLFVPLPLQTVLIQFSDLAGRVQIEYCPTLPQSFSGSTTAADLHGTAAVLPVKVSGDVCGSDEFADGVWLYLARSSITIGAE